ncbi:tigger transposable element-derived protein 6-like [Rhizophagus irregularis DAOM 181602=DAOM 197198]|nr:tigger transposable element-derived protein 6-like [Rhizophagus irregularis DAOM 181602=DAOM 197198]
MLKAKSVKPGNKQLNGIPRKRKSLTAAQKKEICLKKISTPSLKQKELANEYEVSEGMISDILKEKDRWLVVDLDSHQAGLRREKKIPFPIIKETLTLWVESALQVSLIINDDILSSKALELAFLCRKDKFKGSNGWVDNFKKRHNLRQYNMHEEAASAPIQELDTMREEIRKVLKNYALKTSLIVMRQLKDRVTVLLTCNATGSEKLCPLFIHKYENPRALKNINKKTLPVDYHWNPKSWMQVSIWNQYLKKLDARMRTQGQNILLLVDNALTHALFETTRLTNITLEFLPPNTTAHLQPCDQGIINSFKAQYRKLYLHNQVKSYDNFNEYGTEPVKINIKKCIKYIARAWDSVTKTTIENCWLKADILPKDNDGDEVRNDDRIGRDSNVD